MPQIRHSQKTNTGSTAKTTTFDLRALDVAFERQDWTGCWNFIEHFLKANFLTKIDPAHGPMIETGQNEAEEERIRALYGEVGRHLLNLLLHKDFDLPDQQFFRLLMAHKKIHALLRLAGLDQTDPYIGKLKLLKPAPPEKRTRNIKRLLLLLSLNSFRNVAQILKELPVSYAAPALIAYLSHHSLIRKREFENRVALLQSGAILDKWNPDLSIIGYLSLPYIYCSYEDYSQKHEIKKHINRCLEKVITAYMGQRRASGAPSTPIATKKQKLLILAEVFSKNHVLTRMWRDRLKGLKDKFYTVMMVDQNKFDPETASLFDEVHKIDPARMDRAVESIIALDPDIVYYPSIGMAGWTMILSNHRFAPLQIAGLGTAATTKSPYIDYVMGHEGLYNPAAFPGEIFIADSMPLSFIPHTNQRIVPAASFGLPQEKLRVGIICMMAKLTHNFVETVKKIYRQADFPMELVFLTQSQGIDYLCDKQALIEEYGPEITFRGFQPYEDYLAHIQDIDIFLNPYPFGHANTLIDIMLSGKPSVGMMGVESHSMIEKMFWSQIGKEELFIAENEGEYIEKFFALAARLRAGENNFYNSNDVADLFYKETAEETYSRIIEWISKNQSVLKDNTDKITFPPFTTKKFSTSDG